MGVYAAGRFYRAVTEPFLKMLHIAAVMYVIRSKSVSQVMESDMRQAAAFEYLCELVRNIIGTNEPPVRVAADKIGMDVGIAKSICVLRLFLFQSLEVLDILRRHRKSTAAARSLGLFDVERFLAVRNGCARYREISLFEIDR